jgi:plastocyanin
LHCGRAGSAPKLNPGQFVFDKEARVSVWKFAIVAAGTALVLAACGSTSGDTGGGQSCTAKGAGSGTAAQVVKVVNNPSGTGKYDPQTVSVKTGDTVEWDFQDSALSHSVTSDDNTTFDSCLLAAGAKFQVTFSKSGSFPYHCQIHADMTGTVKVG